MAKFKEIYQQNVVPALMKRFNYRNVMQVPRLEKIVVNMGLGEAIQNIKILDSAVQEMSEHHRPEAGHHQGQEIDCPVQTAKGDSDRLHGDASEREDVRILQPPGQCGPSEGEGF